MRSLIVLTSIMVVASCGPSEAERERALAMAIDSTRAATLDEVRSALAAAIDVADRSAGIADRILSPMPVTTTAQEAALRRFLNASHVARARQLGVRVMDEATRDSLVAEGRLVRMADSTDHWIVRPGPSPAYVVPHVPALLTILGERFHERLAEVGLPPYRMEITSATRTASGQARLRQGNANAAAGVSSHEFGTTVDLSYSAFAPPALRPPEVFAGVPAEVTPQVERIVDLAFESVSGRKSREIGAIFSQVLIDAQSEGLALVIYERQQTVYHTTVARALADE